MEFPVLIITGALITFLVLGIPIGIAIGLSVVAGMWAADMPSAFLIQKMFSALDSFPLLAVPLFIMAGEIMQAGSMALRLLEISRHIVGHVTGGFAHITVLTSLFFGALSGSSPATVAAVGGIMIPSMKKEGYDVPYATAVATSAGCLGVIIPPSIPLIIYGTTAGVSVGDLFIAGIIPGFVVGAFLMVISYLIARRRNYVGTGQKSSFVGIIRAVKNGLLALMVPVIVLGGIYGGIMTPTEAGASAVIYSLVAEGLFLKTLSRAKIWSVLRNTALTTASIFIVVATATVLGQILIFNDVPDRLITLFTGISENKYIILSIIILFLLVVGTFMDALANILIFTPLLLPVVTSVGVDPTHFGIIMIIGVSIGFLTPPVGVNLFVGCGISKISIERLSIAVLPFLFAVLVALFVIAFIPSLSLILLR